MRWMSALTLACLICVAIACDKSSSDSKTQKELPPDLQQPSPSAAPTSAPASAPATQASAGQPINKFCAIETKNEIDPKVTTVYEGKTIGFCCKDCIPDFKKDPAKYMASLK